MQFLSVMPILLVVLRLKGFSVSFYSFSIVYFVEICFQSIWGPLKICSVADMCGVCTITYKSYSSKVFYDKKRAWMPSKAGIKKSLMMVLVMCAFRVSITIRYRHSHFLNPRNYDAGVMITDWFDNYNIVIFGVKPSL